MVWSTRERKSSFERDSGSHVHKVDRRTRREKHREREGIINQGLNKLRTNKTERFYNYEGWSLLFAKGKVNEEKGRGG